ncbi:tRNA (adenine(58)-N(1))-methyltransferase, mitochondrial [Electrophorus electricus]|uniref:tRNA (adenine(58)-N(1))-methyltransferase n=1 Tax=Electrophorus electricus TaxID=8005 RepID=A0A4W4GXC6_ELEEL|nr:tRNA (adenine(58)-N(1))-methyltransferase, mitochondrial [Electrophorus electricus]
MTRGLSRVCIAYVRPRRLNVQRAAGGAPPRVCACDLKAFGTDPKGPGEHESGTEAPGARALSRRPSAGAPLTRRRGPLSPLERVSQLLGQEVLTPRRNEPVPRQEDGEHVGQPDAQRDDGAAALGEEPEEQGHRAGEMDARAPPRVLLPGERAMRFGEVLMAEYRRSRRQEFYKMFQLREGLKMDSKWGAIPHEAIEGRPAGTFVCTSIGLRMLIRRPTLEEFTLFMRRGPAISYPKDASTMLLMMDVTEGDCVLESGSGSGAMSLFLSRAVASKGNVLSVEVREDHHRHSKLNYQRWRSAWRLRSGEEWPDNVHFHHGDLITSAPLLDGWSFNSIALDMLTPHLALPTAVPYLHNGGVCAVYLANITQIIDLLEGLRCSTLPLVCERIIEVQYRDWLVAPSLKKDGSFHTRKAPSEETIECEEGDSNDEEHEGPAGAMHTPFGSVPYIARPHPEQFRHTAFLVKLRKVLK